MAKAKRPAKQSTRTNDAERTKADIIAVATEEFAQNGFSGARVDDIAERTRTSKRMIYYYFGSKDGLYRAVLANYYAILRNAERDLHLEDLPPLEALTALVHFTFDFHDQHAENVRLVMVENIHRARHIAQMPSLEPLNLSAIEVVSRICKRGAADGVMRKDLDPLDLYMSIAALSFFNISNRYTFSTIFAHDMTAPAAVAARRASITDMVLRYVAA